MTGLLRAGKAELFCQKEHGSEDMSRETMFV